MKKVILLALLMPYPAFGQIIENFESQSLANWTQSTEGYWSADTNSCLSGMFSLHHVYDNPNSGTDRIGISTRDLHPSEELTKWSFLIRYGYDPSSLNNWSVFLMSDKSPAEMSADGLTNGFALGVNLTGSDDSLRLWKVKGTVQTVVVNCHINWQNDIGIADPVKILVERSTDGNWTVTVSRLNDSLIGRSYGTDSELFNPAWFEIIYRYSSTKDQLLWLDDISIDGRFYTGTEPPVITQPEASAGDIVITEIMADPTPSVSLPGEEYIEITNRTYSPVNLKDWKLSTESQVSLLPETTVAPGGIIIICSGTDTLLFKKYGKVIGLKQFPSLTDEGRILYISDNSGNFIHGVEYSDDWYKDELKSSGGWSLEMIDTDYPFYGGENWKASESRKGGTPGTINSVARSNPDISFHGLFNIFPEDSVTVHVKFQEPVLSFPGSSGKIKIGNLEIQDVYPDDPLFREFNIKLKNPLRRNEIYSIETGSDLSDFAGNQIQKSNFSFGLPEQVVPGDILFNEVLFNPLPGDPDYLELYNRSENILDASRLGFVSVNDESGDKSDPVQLWEEGRCILPGEYFAITSDPDKISERYYSADRNHLFQRNDLPSMSDDKGHIILYSRELEKIDELVYSDEMHYSLLSEFEGIALEKINPVMKSEEILELAFRK